MPPVPTEVMCSPAEETEGVKKKDKKKMKGVKAEKEEKKKGLSKATVKAMQEALAQMKEVLSPSSLTS